MQQFQNIVIIKRLFSHNRGKPACVAGLLLVMLFSAFAAVLPPLAAQDVIIGEPVTYTGLDAKEDGKSLAPLKLTRSPKPKYPAELRKRNVYGYAIALSPTDESIRRYLDGNGDSLPPTSVFGRTTCEAVFIACVDALHNWEWEPDSPCGNDTRRAWVAIIFNPKSASASGKSAAPRLLDVCPVILPPDPPSPAASMQRVAWVGATIGASGEIKNVKLVSGGSFAKRHEAAIVDTVEKWKFAPARSNGGAIEATVKVPVLLIPSLPVPKPSAGERVTLLKPIRQVYTVYPNDMEGNSNGKSKSKSMDMRGVVTLEFALDDKGRPVNPVVVRSPDERFDAPALAAIRQYCFEKPNPAKPDSLGNTYTKLSDARWQYEVNFAPPVESTKSFRMFRDVTYKDPPARDNRGRIDASGPRTITRINMPRVNKTTQAAGPVTPGQNITRPVRVSKRGTIWINPSAATTLIEQDNNNELQN